MNGIKERRIEDIKDVNDEDLFSLFKDYVKKIISEDLERIYGSETHLLNSKEPWIFQLGAFH